MIRKRVHSYDEPAHTGKGNSNEKVGSRVSRKTLEDMHKWRGFLSSLEVTVGLLLCLALVLILTTLIPQHHLLFLRGSSLVEKIANLLSPGNLFHSPWLYGLTALFCVNLILCLGFWIHGNFQRIKNASMQSRDKKSIPRNSQPKEQILRQIGYFFVHASILIIIAGYTLRIFGFEGITELHEGESVNQIVLKGGGVKNLGYAIQCDSFSMDLYENKMPKEYCTKLTFFNNTGTIIHQGTLRVNHPVHFRKIRFYQSHYKAVEQAWISITDRERKTTVIASPGEYIALDKGEQAHVLAVEENVMSSGPAVHLIIETASGVQSLVIFKNRVEFMSRIPEKMKHIPALNPSLVQPYTFSLEKVEPQYITGIAANYDPGVPVTAAGGVMLFIGILLIFLNQRTQLSSQKTPSKKESPL